MNVEMNKLRNEEIQKTTAEERLEKTLHDFHHMKNEHMTVRKTGFFFCSMRNGLFTLSLIIYVYFY